MTSVILFMLDCFVQLRKHDLGSPDRDNDKRGHWYTVNLVMYKVQHRARSGTNQVTRREIDYITGKTQSRIHVF